MSLGGEEWLVLTDWESKGVLASRVDVCRTRWGTTCSFFLLLRNRTTFLHETHYEWTRVLPVNGVLPWIYDSCDRFQHELKLMLLQTAVSEG